VAFKRSLTSLVLPVIVLGGILTGLATPTEAAALAILYALIFGRFVNKKLPNRDIVEVLIRTTQITGVVFLIIASASILGWWMTFEQIPQAIAAGFLAMSDNPNVIIALILALLLIIGLFMDINASLIILAPVLGPLTLQIGMDPVHAGIMIVLALNLSLMTPPVGACLFVLSSVTGEKIEAIAKSLWPFLLAELGVLFLIAYWPDLTLLLPRLSGFVQ
jgi:tripartite ATP-independent transporter DctM subunit